jgi:hypothetical protein
MIGTGLAILGAGPPRALARRSMGPTRPPARRRTPPTRPRHPAAGAGLQKQNYDPKAASRAISRRSSIPASAPTISSRRSTASTAQIPRLVRTLLLASSSRPTTSSRSRAGHEALDNSAAAKGGVLGGNQIRAQTEYGQGLATQNLQNYLGRLSGLSGQGIQAGGYLGQIGTGVGSQVGASANNMANSTMAAGTAEASGILGMTRASIAGLIRSRSTIRWARAATAAGVSPTGGTGLNLNNTGGLY